MAENTDGVVVHGVHSIRVAPDVAALAFGVSRLRDSPAAAIRAASDAVRAVRRFLLSAKVPSEDIGASRVTLKQETEYRNSKHVPVGFRALVSFRVITDQLEQVETLLIGVIDAGADQIAGVSFMSRRARELRDEARRGAVDSARRKAALYAGAAHARVGRVLAIEDQNPNHIREGEYGSHVTQSDDSSDDLGAYDPGSLLISAAVVATFELVHG